MSSDSSVEETTTLLLEKHKPILYYHHKEKFFADNPIDWFKKTKADGEKRTAPKDSNGKILAYNYAKYSKKVKIIGKQTEKDNKIYLSYLIFFPFNGNKRILGVFPSGAHWADLEEFHVVLDSTDENNYKVLYYVMSSHGDGHVYNADGSVKDSFKDNVSVKDIKLEFKKDTSRAKVYISVNSHALYGAPGSYVRFGGAGNDNTSKGKELDPEMLLSTHSSLQDVMSWTGKLGPDGIDDIPNRFDKDGVPKLISKKIKPHFRRVPALLMYIPYILWLILPIIIIIYFGANYNALLMAGITLPLQMYTIRCILKTFGSKSGLKYDPKAFSDESMCLNVFKFY